MPIKFQNIGVRRVRTEGQGIRAANCDPFLQNQVGHGGAYLSQDEKS